MLINTEATTEDATLYRVGIISAPHPFCADTEVAAFVDDAKDIAGKCSFRSSCIISFSEINPTRFMFIITGKANDATTCAYNMIMRLRRKYDTDFSLSMSTSKKDLDSLTDAVCEALRFLMQYSQPDDDLSDGGENGASENDTEAEKINLPNYFSSITHFVDLYTDAVINTDDPSSIVSISHELFELIVDNNISPAGAYQICSDIFICSASKLLNIFKENKIVSECINDASMSATLYGKELTYRLIDDSFVTRYTHIQRVLKTYFSSSAPVSTTLIETLNYLLKTQCSKVTLQYMADYLNVSSSYLSSSFKKKTGYSFREYVRQYKMEQSKFYLIHSQLTVSQIAIKLGYNDIVNFSRIFKKSFDISPSEFRSQNRHDDYDPLLDE